MNDVSDLMNWLEQDDERSRPFRAARLRLLLEEYGPEGHRMFYGGPVSLWAFEECRRGYLHGLFLCCILSAQVCIEHMLAALFRMAGRDDLDHASFKRLLQEARGERYLSEEEVALFDRLRTLRNPYAHPRPPTANDAVGRRAVQSDITVEDVLVADAEHAVTALLRLCRRRPFAI